MNAGDDNSEQIAVVADAELAEWEIISMDDLESDLVPDVSTPEDDNKNDGNTISSECSTQDELTGDCGSDAKESSNTTTTTTDVRACAGVLDELPPVDSSEVRSSDSVDRNPGQSQSQDDVFDLTALQEIVAGADEALDKAGESEVCSKMKNLLAGATKVLSKARELDVAGSLPGALTLYKTGLEKLIASMKLCRNEDQKALMVGKCKVYLSRAEKLKETLAKEGNSARAKEEAHPALSAVKEFQVTDPPALTLKEVAGLQEAKEALLLKVLLPLKFPNLHPAACHHTILLYGAPGVGKTMLARAVLGELKSVCSNMYYAHISDFLSRSGGARKLRELFRLTEAESSSFVVLDDLESLFCGGGEQSQGQRQTMSELLCHMLKARQGHHVLVAATNSPQSMPASFRKKFTQRVYCPLPGTAERKEVLQTMLKTQQHSLSEADVEELAGRTEMFMGADLVCFMRDLFMVPLRNLTHIKKISAREGGEAGGEKWVPCQPSDPQAVEIFKAQLESDQLEIPAITMEDALSVLARTKPTVNSEMVAELESLRADYN